MTRAVSWRAAELRATPERTPFSKAMRTWALLGTRALAVREATAEAVGRLAPQVCRKAVGLEAAPRLAAWRGPVVEEGTPERQEREGLQAQELRRVWVAHALVLFFKPQRPGPQSLQLRIP